MPAVLRLTVPPAIVREFKRKAKEAFPRETFGFLLGTLAGDRAHVDEIWFPPDVEQHATTGSVEIQDSWYVDAEEAAKDSELSVIGTAHSHPYVTKGHLGDRAHSERDHDAMITRSISGICVVQKGKNDRLRASMRFWGPSVAVEMRD